MNIRTGLVITVRHYSLLNVFKCIVVDTWENTVIAKLPKEALKATFMKYDPLVVAFESGESINISGGRLTGIDPEREQFSFVPDNLEEYTGARSYERFPVSLYADFRLADGGRKCFALVKDISDHGLMIYSKDAFHIGQRLYLDVFLVRDIMSLTAEIVRITRCDEYYEYGLKIMHSGPAVLNHIKSFIKKAQEEHQLKFNKE